MEKLTVMGAASLEVSGALAKPMRYDPDEWQFQMDSTRLEVSDGPKKLQGVPLGKVLEAMEPQANAQTVLVNTGDEPVSLPLDDILADDDLRLFTLIGEADVTFVLARMSGEVLVSQVTSIEVQ